MVDPVEQWVRDALLDEVELQWRSELDHLQSADIPVPSAAYQEWAQSFLLDVDAYHSNRHNRRISLLKRIVRTTLAAAAITTLLLGSAFAVSPTVCVWVSEWFETHHTYHFVNDLNRTKVLATDRTINALPDGYIEVEREVFDDLLVVYYKNEAGDQITLTGQPMTEGSVLDMSNEDFIIQDLTIGDKSAQLYLSENGKKYSSVLIFDDKDTNWLFVITALQKKETLITMAESIFK